MTEHYTTLTVAEFNKIQNVIIILRWKIQKARELLEQDRVVEAKAILSKAEDEKETI